MTERSAVLVVSVWVASGTPERLRARVTAYRDVHEPGVLVGTAAGGDGILDLVRDWLREVDSPTVPGREPDGDEGGDGAVTVP